MQPYLAAERIERANLRAAHAHEMLNYLVARCLLEIRARFAGDGVLFGPVLHEVESLYKDRERVNLSDLPAGILSPLPTFPLCFAWIIQVRFTPSGPRPFQTAVLPCLFIPNFQQTFSRSSQVNVYPISLPATYPNLIPGKDSPCPLHTGERAVSTNNAPGGYRTGLNKTVSH